jgi:hypothetical protein
VIHYHGTPMTPNAAAIAALSRRHAMVSHFRPDQIEIVAEVCQSFCLDNGAYSHWKKGHRGRVSLPAYSAFVRQWDRHPGFDWYLIPDSIDGDEAANDRLLAEWREVHGDYHRGVPVWHMHESLDRLYRFCHAARNGVYERVALGSSGQYSTVGMADWWVRMAEAMGRICDERGRPICRLHGLRMLNPTVFSHLPLASADSCNVARNIGIDAAWRGTYVPVSPGVRAQVMMERIEGHASASLWNPESRGVDENLQLMG